jgi:hypothetical protein
MNDAIWWLVIFLIGYNAGAVLWYWLIATPEQRKRVDAFVERHFL